MNEVTKIDAPEDNTPVSATPMEMIDRALANGADVTVIEKLMAMAERWQAMRDRAEFSAAKADAMAEMPKIPRNGLNKHTNQRYSTIDDIRDTVRPVLARHGMTLSHRTEVADGELLVTAVLAHANGQQDTNSLPVSFDNGQQRNAAQARGSSQTYGERYTAKSLLGLSTGDEDDDGQKAGAGETITADQFRALQEKLDKVGPDNERRLLNYLKIENLEELPLSKLGTADAALDRKIKEVENA